MPRPGPDVLVIGPGLAGLYAALRAAHHGRRVTLLTKGTLETSNSYWAQGGIAVAVALEDDPAQHAADTVAAGDGLCDRAAVQVLCEDGVRRLCDLEALGIVFDRPLDDLEEGVRDAMRQDCGLIRSAETLERALGRVETSLVALLVVTSALRRTESRGGHYRSDFPSRDDARARRFPLRAGG